MKPRFSRWYEGGLLLSMVRGMALSLSMVLFFIFHDLNSFLFLSYFSIGIVAAYTIIRIIYPFHWYGKRHLSYFFISADVLVCCGLPFVTGGFSSPFILYPITAILSASLFFPQKTSYAIAGITTVLVMSSDVVSHQVFGIGAILPVQLYVALTGMYVIVGFLLAWLPYVANINLYDTVKQRAIIDERSRLSRELHDGPAQRLALLIMKVNLLKASVRNFKNPEVSSQIEKLKSELLDAHMEVREVIDQLRLKVPENPGMLPTLAQYARDFSRYSGIPCHAYLADGYTELTPLAIVELLRIAQEALTNVRKHSKASKVELNFESKADHVTMIIKDDGCGFNAGMVAGRHGLEVMRERAHVIGGKCEINSSPDHGTEVMVTVPIRGRV